MQTCLENFPQCSGSPDICISTKDSKLCVYSQKTCLTVLNLNFLKVFFFPSMIFLLAFKDVFIAKALSK